MTWSAVLLVTAVVWAVSVTARPAPALVYSLPLPMTLALVSTGYRVDGAQLLGVLGLNLFFVTVAVTHHRLRWPILLADGAGVGVYVALSAGLLAVPSRSRRPWPACWCSGWRRCCCCAVAPGRTPAHPPPPPGDCRFRGRRRFKGRHGNVERRPSGGAAGAAQAGGHLRRGDPHRAARCGATRHGGDVSLLGGAGRRRGPPRAARVQSALRPQQPGAGRFPHRLPLPPGRVVGPGAGRRLGGLRVGRRRPAPTAAHPTGSAGPHRHEPHRLEPHRAGSHGRAACPTFRRPEARRSSLGRSEP